MKSQIIAQWQRFFNLYHELQGENPQKQNAALLSVAMPRRVAKTVEFMQKQTARGEKEVGTYNFGPTDVIVTGRSASLVECRNESNIVVRSIETGKVIKMGDTQLKLTAKLLRDAKGVWRLVSYDAGDC